MNKKIHMLINILVIMFMPFMRYININGAKVNISLADILLMLVGIIFLINIKEFFIHKRWLYFIYFAGLLLSLFLSQYISHFNNNFLHAEYSVMIMEMVKTLVVSIYFFTAFMFIKNESNFKLSLVVISLSSVPVMIIGFTSYIYFLLGKDFFIDAYKIGASRFLGSFEDPNLCAFYFILIFFVSLLNFKIVKNVLLRFFMLGISVLSLIIIFLTMSRGAWLALVGAIVVLILLNIKSVRKEIFLMIFLILNIVFISIDLDYYCQQGKITNEIVARVQDSLNKNANDINRVQLMKAAYQMGNNNFLFGVGKGSFSLNLYKYISKDNLLYLIESIPHNTILGFYAQQGIFGVLVFITLPGYILYSMIRSRGKHNLYLIPVFVGLFIHSLTINVENVRFLWYILGLMLAAEKIDIDRDFISPTKLNKRTFAIILAAFLSLAIFFYVDISRKIIINIYTYKGNAYQKVLHLVNSGNYELTFDIETDNHLNYVEIYDDDKLLKKMNFKSAYGVAHIPIYVGKRCRIEFKANYEGWMKVKNAYIIGENKKIPLYNYILLPRFAEDWFNQRGLLVYSDEASYKENFNITDEKLNKFEIIDAKVIRYSNLSHVFQFDLKSKQKVAINYRLLLLLDYHSIADLLPDEYQKNVHVHQFSLYPDTSKWELGKEYSIMSNRLFASEAFDLYGFYDDYTNNIYSQGLYFPIHYDLVKEKQNVIGLGESQWINVNYSKENDGNIHMTNNAWVESERMNLKPGDYELTFKAQGSFLEEYSKLRIRDSNLKEMAEIILDDTMKEYTIKYHVDEPAEGISFVLELINYKSEDGVGNRQVLLKDWLKVE